MTDEIDVHPITDKCWTEERPALMNSSEVACLFGLHDYKTIAGVTAAKRGLKGTDPDKDSPLIRRGHALEDDAIDEIQKLYPTWRISRGTQHYVDHKHRMAATPDALVVDPERAGVGSLQIKVVSQPVFNRKWREHESPPIGYLLQLEQEMMLIPGCTWGAIGALVIGDFSFGAHVYPIDRNRAAETRLRTAAIEFWKKFDAGDQPVIDFERDGDLIALMYPTEVPGKIIDLTFDNSIRELLEQRETLRLSIKDAEAMLSTCETEMKSKLGDAEVALVSGWRVTFKSQHRKAHQVQESSFRVLRSTREKRQQA